MELIKIRRNRNALDELGFFGGKKKFASFSQAI